MSKNDEQKESPKHTHSSILRTFSSQGLLNTNKQNKYKDIWYVNQRDDMLTKTRN
jgi:hypothetical protein